MPNEPTQDSAEPEPEAEETEESESSEPTIADLVAEIAELKKSLATPKKEESEESVPEKDKPKTDPLHIDYAEYLKSQMGKAYPKEFDKLPLDIRIPAMKAVLNTTKVKPAAKEGNVAKGTPIDTFKPTGTNYKELAKQIRGIK